MSKNKSLSHKEKVILAKRLITPDEIAHNVGIFDSAAWLKRRKQVSQRVRFKQQVAHDRAEHRRYVVSQSNA